MSEVTLIMGYPASGKTTEAEKFVAQGFHRINRDTLGGKVIDLVPKMSAIIAQGKSVVIDNLFASKTSRKPFIDACKKQKTPIKCVWINTSIEDAQLNACLRMVKKHGRILEPDEISKVKDPNTFPIAVLFKYKKEFERPSTVEGFSSVDVVQFVRQWDSEYKNGAIIFDYDGTLRESTGDKAWPEAINEVTIMDNRLAKMGALKSQKILLLGASNQSPCSKGLPRQTAEDCLQKTNELLGVDIEFAYCPHRAAPPSCWCRKPFPGMAAEFIVKHKLLPGKCVMIGDKTSDKTFAQRAGFKFKWAHDFFGEQDVK